MAFCLVFPADEASRPTVIVTYTRHTTVWCETSTRHLRLKGAPPGNLPPSRGCVFAGTRFSPVLKITCCLHFFCSFGGFVLAPGENACMYMYIPLVYILETPIFWSFLEFTWKLFLRFRFLRAVSTFGQSAIFRVRPLWNLRCCTSLTATINSPHVCVYV